MSLNSLRKKIEEREARLAVIGLGYVGLPVACQFAEVGFDVLGVEIIPERVSRINRGISPIEGSEPGLAQLLGKVISRTKLHATSDYLELDDRDVILIDVESPVDEHNIPRYEALRAALASMVPVIKPGVLVIVESTIAPGTMTDVVLPALTESSGLILNQTLFLGHCPERVMPGKLLANLANVSRVVGGMTMETADSMLSLYRHIVSADLDPTDCVTAELVKTTENAYRDVQIAFSNEIAKICESVGGDVWRVRQLVNKSPYRQMHLPGAGVGGHCIPKDPWLLAYGVQDKNLPLHLIPAARAVNDAMPVHVAQLLVEVLRDRDIEIDGAKILVLGYAYLENSDDVRNSPSQTLVEYLHTLGAQVVIHDPYVAEYNQDLYSLASGCDAVVIMVRHDPYRQLDIDLLKSRLRSLVIVDGRQVINPANYKEAGFTFRVLGQSSSYIQ